MRSAFEFSALPWQRVPSAVASWVGMGRPDHSATAALANPSDEEIRHQLDEIIESPAFETSQRNRKFLRYVVEETLAGRAERIKAYSVATVVFARDPDFDPQTDPIIRIEASRLRRALDHYYLVAGRDDPVRIVVPKGSYVPVFEYNRTPPSDTAEGHNQKRRRIITTRPNRRSALIAIGFALVILVGASGYLARSAVEAPTAPSEGIAANAYGASLAVLPFEVVGPPSERRPSLGERLALDVAASLTRFPDLFVFSPETGGSRRATDYVLNARGEFVDERLRISVGLVDARSDQQLWSGTFEIVAAGPGILPRTEALAGRIARAVAAPRGAIFAQQARGIALQPVKHATPYQCVQRYQLYWRNQNAAQLAETRECLERAIKIDPTYASAHATLALAQLDLIRFREAPRSKWGPVLDAALASARRAIELAPGNPRGYQALQHVKWLQGEVEQSLAAGERALALNPNDPEIVAELGFRYGLLGEWPKALPLLEQALADDPDLPSMYRQVTSLHLYLVGRYEDALSEANRIDLPNHVYAHALRAIAYAKTGRPEKARASIQRILALEPHFAATMGEDLRARNVHPVLIKAIADGLRDAGLETVEVVGG